MFKKDGGFRAGLAYYRAAFLSAQQTRAFAARGKLAMPVLAIGSDQGSISDMATPPRSFADDVRGGSIPFCGYFLPEEQPDVVARGYLNFLSRSEEGRMTPGGG